MDPKMMYPPLLSHTIFGSEYYVPPYETVGSNCLLGRRGWMTLVLRWEVWERGVECSPCARSVGEIRCRTCEGLICCVKGSRSLRAWWCWRGCLVAVLVLAVELVLVMVFVVIVVFVVVSLSVGVCDVTTQLLLLLLLLLLPSLWCWFCPHCGSVVAAPYCFHCYHRLPHDTFTLPQLHTWTRR